MLYLKPPGAKVVVQRFSRRVLEFIYLYTYIPTHLYYITWREICPWPAPGWLQYCASKAALHAAYGVLREELRPKAGQLGEELRMQVRMFHRVGQLTL